MQLDYTFDRQIVLERREAREEGYTLRPIRRNHLLST